MVDWLYHHVEGFPERREARKYASGLLKAGLIRHTVNKITFSEQCYYVFGDLSGGCESCECLLLTSDLAQKPALHWLHWWGLTSPSVLLDKLCTRHRAMSAGGRGAFS